MAIGTKPLRALLLAGAMGMAASSANAATIILHDIGGVTPGTDAYDGFRRAANFWGSQFSNDITINLNVGFNHLGPNILGSTRSTFTVKSVQSVENHLIAGASGSAIDQSAVTNLPALSPTAFGVGGLDVVTPGYTHPDGVGNPFGTGNPYGIDNSTNVYDTDGSFNNVALGVTTANAKALGYAVDPTTIDGSITFSSDFAFDFNPTDGVTPGKIDFLSVATHEIGHALGFVSGVDDYDVLGGPNSPYASYDCGGFKCQDYPANDDWFGETLDLFRYSNDPKNAAPGNGPVLTWAPGVESYFSVDSGASSLGGFSTGEFNGDGWQASHWKAPTSAPFCSGLLGIMNPYACNGHGGIVTNLDREAFDAIGYNLNDQGSHDYTTADIYRNIGVPEPATWALLISGFGLTGLVLRRRRSVVAKL
jgi:hypothetical protein